MRFWRDESGAALIYVSILMVALVGIAGLALDSGRLFSLRHEMQNAADAAALAGAWQLDGTAAGSVQADFAARNAVVVNNQKFGNSSGAVTIASTAFYSSVPADDDTALTANAPPYDYIGVTTTGVVQNTLLMRALGAPATVTLSSTAVARKGQAICQVTPLFMCLPGGAAFDPTLWIGHQVLMKAAQGNSWTNGNWGLLDTPGGSQSAGALASMIAGTNGLPQCIGTGVDTKPGNVASISPAFNVRLDMYENLPGNVNYRTTAGYPPAENVTKGKIRTNTNCSDFNNTATPTKLPRDADIISSNGATRFGNGQWDCLGYWNNAHPGDTVNMPAGCSSTGGLTRYEMYLHEVTALPNKGLIPDLTNNNTNPNEETGDPAEQSPICYTGGPIPPTPTSPTQRINDRRIFTVAGVDCTTVSINGNTPNVPVQQYLSMFITEPAGTQGQTNGDVYMEIVGYDANGGGGLVPIQLREWVELVR
ncbi:MAG: pilus assembly protein TadG-related protein [Pseudomonadota bacterium]